jgi:Beta-ketoacyl synthase, N-terminal domain
MMMGSGLIRSKVQKFEPPGLFLTRGGRTIILKSEQGQDNATPKPNGKYRDRDRDIVISGISGRFPQSDNMEEFKRNLFSKTDMVTEQKRFKEIFITKRLGLLENLDKFDAGFFHIVPKLAHYLDPMQRKLLEVSFEALVDAGVNPEEVKGSKTGVWVGAAGEASKDFWNLHSNGSAEGEA